MNITDEEYQAAISNPKDTLKDLLSAPDLIKDQSNCCYGAPMYRGLGKEPGLVGFSGCSKQN